MNLKSRWIFLAAVLLLIPCGAFFAGKVSARAESSTMVLYSQPVCLPGLYKTDPRKCLAVGPLQTIRQMSDQGIAYPTEELPAASPDYALTELPVYVAKINSGDAVPVFGNLGTAQAGGPAIRTLASGPMRYVAVYNMSTSSGRTMVQMESGEWIEATPLYSWTRFQGLEFSQNPKTSFGWAVNPAPVYQGPGFSYPTTGRELKKYENFQVYQTAPADGYTWYRIGRSEWVNSLKTRQFVLSTKRPDGVEGDRWIDINLENQTLGIYEKGQLKFASLIASGLDPFFTQPGVFQIYKDYETVTMQDAYEADRSDYYHLQAVPWALFYDRNTAIHGVYWPVMLGFQQSHGCVNMSPGDAHWVYNWAKVGDWVWVHDPSGKTPLDSPLYAGENQQ